MYYVQTEEKKQCLCCIFSQLAPENTYMSFEKALAAGADGLETDVTIRSTPKKVCFIYNGSVYSIQQQNVKKKSFIISFCLLLQL